MFRTSSLEVTLRRQEQLRDAEARRFAASVRRPDHRPTRITWALGLRGALAR